MKYTYIDDNRLDLFHETRVVQKLSSGKYQVWLWKSSQKQLGKIAIMYSWNNRHEASEVISRQMPGGRDKQRQRQKIKDEFIEQAHKMNKEFDKLAAEIRLIEADNWQKIGFWDYMRHLPGFEGVAA